MDIETLSAALKSSLSPNNEERSVASQFIKASEKQEIYPLLLLEISYNEKYQLDIRQNASIQLKNYVGSYWKSDEVIKETGKISLSQENKTLIRKNIFEVLEKCTHKVIKKNYLEVIKKILKVDYNKNQWNEYVPYVKDLLTSNDEKKVSVGIEAFHKLARESEFELLKNKEKYFSDLFVIQPILEEILETLIKNFQVEAAARIIKKILKIYHTNIQMSIPKYYTEINSITKWFNILNFIIRLDLDPSLENKNEIGQENLSKNIYWKIKFQCFNILFKIFQRYGVEKDTEKEFTRFVDEKLTVEIFNLFIWALYSSSTKYLPDNIISLIFKFLNQLVVRKRYMNEIEKHLDKILKEFVIQLSFLKKSDQELFENNPKNYVYKRYDYSENFFNTRHNIHQFVKNLCSYKLKGKKNKIPVYFSGCYQYLLGVLKTYEEQKSLGSQPDLRIKEAVMNILQNMSELIDKFEKDSINLLLTTYVIPEFESPVGMIRERACELVQSFEIENLNNEALFKNIVNCILKSLEDKELPVKITAAIGVPYLLKKKEGVILLKPFISNILRVYLKFMEEIDLDELLQGLEQIVGTIGEELIEFSLQLVQQLVIHYQRLIKVDYEEDEGEAQMASASCLKTILKLMDTSSKNLENYQKIEEVVEIIIKHGFTQEGFDNIEDSIMILGHMSSKSPVISNRTLSYFQILIDSLTGTPEEIKEFLTANSDLKESDYRGIGYEFNHKIVPIIMNIIIRKPELVLAGNHYFLKRLLYLFEKGIKAGNEDQEERDCGFMIKMLITILETLKGSIDEYLEPAIKILLDQIMNHAKVTSYKNLLIQAVASLIYYNPLKTISIFESLNSGSVISAFIQNVGTLSTVTQLKRASIGLTSLLLNIKNQIVQQNIIQIISQIILIEKKISELSAKNNLELEGSDNEEEEEIDEEIKKAVLETAQKNDELEFDDDFDDDDSDLDDEEIIVQKTELEKLDQLEFFKIKLTDILQYEPQFYNILSEAIKDKDALKALLDKK